MNTTLKHQSTNRKTRIIAIFLGMFIILAGGVLLAANNFGDEVIAPAIMFLFALLLQRHFRLVQEEPVGDRPGWLLCQPGIGAYAGNIEH